MNAGHRLALPKVRRSAPELFEEEKHHFQWELLTAEGRRVLRRYHDPERVSPCSPERQSLGSEVRTCKDVGFVATVWKIGVTPRFQPHTRDPVGTTDVNPRDQPKRWFHVRLMSLCVSQSRQGVTRDVQIPLHAKGTN